MFVDIRKLTRQQVKEVLEAAGWAWDDAKSIDGERNRRDCEALVNEAYKRGFKAGINAKTQVAAADAQAAWPHAGPHRAVQMLEVAAAPADRAAPQPVPAAQWDALPREDFAWLVVQEACDTEPADEDDPECIRILRRDLKSAVLAAFLRHCTAAARAGKKEES